MENNNHKTDYIWNIDEYFDTNLNLVYNNSYKNKNKKELFDLCNDFYNTKNIFELDRTCELYLSYFKDLDDKDVRTIMFYYGFANFTINSEKAINIFEELYSNPNIEQDIKTFTGYNLDMLYPKQHGEIPKIIHYIYLGGRPIQNYHYRCIQSALLHMPEEYKIYIHCNEEPIDNKYWDNLKNNSRVSIKYVECPEYFDGFKLNYIQYKADVLRMNIIYEYGGIYLDTDMLIVKNFEDIFKSNKSLYISKEYDDNNSGLINSFIAAKPKNEFIKLWLDSFKSGLRMDIWAYHIRDSNKLLIKKYPYYLYKYQIEILPSINFFPVHWQQKSIFECIEPYNFSENTYGCHLWDTILGDILKENKFFPNDISYFMDLAENIIVL